MVGRLEGLGEGGIRVFAASSSCCNITTGSCEMTTLGSNRKRPHFLHAKVMFVAIRESALASCRISRNLILSIE